MSSSEKIKLSNYEYESDVIAELLDTKYHVVTEYFDLNSTTSPVIGQRIYRSEGKYLLPPITQSGSTTATDNLVEFLNNFFNSPIVKKNAPSEILIHYNPGGHWIVLRVRIPFLFQLSYGDSITIEYIDSLDNQERKNVAKNFLLQLENRIDTFKFSKFAYTIQTPKVQPDGVSCGVVMVENL